MNLQFFETYLSMATEGQAIDTPDTNTDDAGSIPTVRKQYDQLLKLITTAIDTAMPPTLILSGNSTDLTHTLRLTAPTECYRDHRNGRQRPTDFAPSAIDITPTQYQLAQHTSASVPNCLREYAINNTLGPYLTPITFTIGLCSERYTLQDSVHPALHCILFHENLAKEVSDGPSLVTSISDYLYI